MPLKHIFIWLQLIFGKCFGSSTYTPKKFEWLGIQRAVENKDVSWNSAFSRCANTKVERRFTGTEQRRRCQLHKTNCHIKAEKDNASKSTKQCQSCGISICREHSTRVCHGCLQWNFIWYFIFIVLKCSFMHYYNCILYQLRSYKTCLSWK